MVEQIASRWPASLEPSALAGAAVLVAGLGRSGRSAALHLAELGADVLACDDGQPERAALALFTNTQLLLAVLGGLYVV
ncbi:MAG TPA: hypothetical protein VGA45_02070, partial [Actinomycetota bacterium]